MFRIGWMRVTLGTSLRMFVIQRQIGSRNPGMRQTRAPTHSEWPSSSKTEDKPKKPTILNYRRHRDADKSVPKYLVKNLLTETGVGLLSGQSGTYKSFIGIKLVGAVGMRQPFAGYDVKRQGASLIFASEGAGELPIRLEALSEVEHGGQVLPVYYCDV